MGVSHFTYFLEGVKLCVKHGSDVLDVSFGGESYSDI